MAEYDIIGGVVSAEAIKQMNDFEAQAKRIAEIVDGIKLGGIGGGSGGGKPAAEFDALTEANKRLVKQMRELEIAQQQISQQAEKIKQQRRETIQTYGSEEGSVKQMRAELKRLEDAYYSLSKVARESAQGISMQKTIKGFADEVNKVQMNVGNFSKNVGNYSSAMNMFGINMGMVMKELPNFAISARIGIMSLTNNLPMLAESLKAVRLEQAAMKAEGKATTSMLSLIGKSIFGLTGIVSLLMVGLQVGAPYLEKWFNSMIEGTKAVKHITNAQMGLLTVMQSLHRVMESGGGVYGEAISKLESMTERLKIAKKTHYEEKEAVDEYNKSLGETFGKAKDVSEALDLIGLKSNAYIKAMEKMAFANAFFAQSSADAVKAMEVGRKSQRQILTEALGSAESADTLMGDMAEANREVRRLQSQKTPVNPAIMNIAVTRQQMLTNKIAEIDRNERARQLGEINSHQEMALALARKYYKERSIIAKNYGLDLTQQAGGTGGTGDKYRSGKEMFVELKTFQEERIRLTDELGQAQIDMAEKTESGELNSYEKRIEAARKYFNISKLLNQLDLETEETNLNEKYKNDKKKLQDDANSNEALFKSGELTNERILELRQQFIVADGNLDKNYKADQLALQDKFAKEEIDNKVKNTNNLLKISQDFFKLQEQIEAEALAKANKSTDTKYSKMRSKIESKNSIYRLFGLNDTYISDVVESVSNVDKIQNEIDSQQRLADSVFTTEKEKINIKKRIAELEVNIEEEKNKRLEAAQNKLQDVIAESQKSVIDNLTSLWGELFDYLDRRVDESLEKQTKINDEKVKQYQDETDAGMHSQKEMSDYKDRMAAYQQSQEEDAAKKKEDLERSQFLITQAFSIAQIWMKYAEAQQAIQVAAGIIDAATVGVGGTPYRLSASGWNLAAAITGTALAASQAIPYFEHGTESSPEGYAVVGEKRHELGLTKSGKMFITPDTPTLTYLEQGTKIFPDVNKVDILSLLATRQVIPDYNNTDSKMIGVLNSIDKSIKNQKRGNFYGMPLIKQMENKDYYSKRRKSLMN